MKEEVDLIVAIRNGHPEPQCEHVPCYALQATYKPGPLAYHTFRPEDPALRYTGQGGLQVTDKKPTFEAPAGLPIGDNGYINFGIDSRAGLANILPGLLPDNAYWSQAKMAALVAKDPAAAHWYAVFNTPDPAHPGQVLWTVMHAGQVVDTAQILIGS